MRMSKLQLWTVLVAVACAPMVEMSSRDAKSLLQIFTYEAVHAIDEWNLQCAVCQQTVAMCVI